MMPTIARWFRGLHPLQRLAVVAWVTLLLGVGGRVTFSPPGAGSVVPIYLHAAQQWADGADLYAPAWPLDMYRNPPWVAAAFVPFTWVPVKAASLLWLGLSTAVFLVALVTWVRHGLPRPLSAGESGAVFVLAALLVFSSLNNGQTNLILTGFLLLGATAAARGSGPAAGLWLALAAGIKLFPAAAGLLVAAAFPRRVLPWFVLALAAVAAAPFALADADYVIAQHRGFRDLLAGDDRTFADFGRAPRDLFLVLRVWFEPPSREVYRGIQFGAAAVMFGLVVLAARRVGEPRYVSTLALNLGCVWMTVLGPASEAHTYTMLGPTAAAVAVLAFADRNRSGGRAAFVLAAAGAALLISPVLRDMFPNGSQYQKPGPHPVGGLLVLAAVLLDAAGRVSSRRPGAPGPDGTPRFLLHAPGRVAT
jgi:hypothetical protein